MSDTPPAPIPPLRSDLQYTVHRQGDRLWYAVEDPRSKRFMRLGQKEYQLASLFDGQRDAAAVLDHFEALQADRSSHRSSHGSSDKTDSTTTATLAEVHGLSQWLLTAKCLQTPEPADEPSAAAGIKINPLYTRIPLVPGLLLERIAGRLRFAVSAPALVLAAIVVLLAAFNVLSNWDLFHSTVGELFVAEAQVWWLLAWLLLKTAHELGHAVFAVAVGSRIRSAGISLIFLAPVPYVDVSDLWTIPNRWHRMLVCGGGMLVELTLAAVAALVATNTDNLSLQYFCCSVASLGTFTTLAFNANPLMRFDGYFILSDWLDRPNLWTDAQNSVKAVVSKIQRPSRPLRHRVTIALCLYGLACYQYRFVMLFSLAVGCILVWQGVGVALVLWASYGILWLPLARVWKARVAARSGPAAVKPTPLAWLWRGALLTGLMALVFLAPSPVQPTTPGIVNVREPQTVRNETEGFLTQVLKEDGDWVREGDLLAVLENTTLQLNHQTLALELEATRETIRAARSRGELAEVQSYEARQQSLEQHLLQLSQKIARLEVRAPADGQLIDFKLQRELGRFLSAGQPLAIVGDPRQLEICGLADQQTAEQLRSRLDSKLVVWQPGLRTTEARLDKVDLRGSDELTEPSLAGLYGGILPVEHSEKEGGPTLKMTSPRFELHLVLPSPDPGCVPQFVPGQRVFLNRPETSITVFEAVVRWFQQKQEQLRRQSQQVASQAS